MRALGEITVEEVEGVEEVLEAISRNHVGWRRKLDQCVGLPRLNLIGTDLTLVSIKLLRRVVYRVHRLEVENVKVTDGQLEDILYLVGRETPGVGATKLKHLAVSEMDLKSVDPCLLAYAVNRAESVRFNLKTVKVTCGQAQSIYTVMANTETKLKQLTSTVSCSVPTHVLAKAVNKLQEFYSTTAGDKAEAILEQSLVHTKLTSAIITIPNWECDQDLLTKGRKVIQHLDVSARAVYHAPSDDCPNDHPKEKTGITKEAVENHAEVSEIQPEVLYNQPDVEGEGKQGI